MWKRKEYMCVCVYSRNFLKNTISEEKNTQDGSNSRFDTAKKKKRLVNLM